MLGAPKVPKARLAPKGLRDRRDSKANKVRLGLRARKANKGAQGRKEPRVIKVRLGLRARKATKAAPVLRARPARKANRVPRVRLARMVRQGLPAPPQACMHSGRILAMPAAAVVLLAVPVRSLSL